MEKKGLNLFQRVAAFFTRSAPLTEATSRTETPGEWRRLTDNNEQKGLNLISRLRQYKIVFKMYLTNPMAHWIIDTLNDFVCGDGFEYEVDINRDMLNGLSDTRKAEVLQQATNLLNVFWRKNRLDLNLLKFIKDLSLNGALCLSARVNEINGSVRLGFIDPANIETVVTDPLDVLSVQGVKLAKDKSGNPITLKGITEKIGVENITAEDYGLLDGQVFYFAINNVTNQPEGISDLLAVIDYLDVKDQMLFNIVENMRVQNLFVLDVEIKDADDKKLRDWEEKNPMPKTATRFLHNQDVKQEYKTPEIQGQQSSEMFRLIKNFILGAFSFPENWYADGGNANLATAVEQTTPIFRKLKARQQYVMFIIEQILTFVLHKAFNKLEGFTITRQELEAINIRVKAPEFETRNVKEITTALDTLTDAINKGVEAGYITEESGAACYRLFLQLTGFELDEQSEKAELEKQKKDKENKDGTANNTQGQKREGDSGNIPPTVAIENAD